MDQDAFRQTYREVNARACAYEKSILTQQCGCSRAERFCIAEREGVGCKSQHGQSRCLAWLAILQEQARFTLRVEGERRDLPHGKAMRVQVGGLRGLLQALQPDAELALPIPDVYALIAAAQREFGTLDALPFSQIMRQVAAHRGRSRSKRRRK